MPEKTKQEKDCPKSAERKTETIADDETETEAEENWSEDQRRKSYYYDDAYGYEIYNPDEDDDAENC